MQCEDHHHHESHQHHAHDNHDHVPETEFECLHGLATQAKANSLILHCPADWDPVVGICWPPAMPGTKSSLPCPDKPDINHLHYACRKCLTNGSWHVNHAQDPDQAYTNYHDCFLFEEEEFKLKMEQSIGKDKLVIYETLNHPGDIQSWIHGISIFLIGVCIFIWILKWNSRKGRANIDKYKMMCFSCLALFAIHILAVVYDGMWFYEYLTTCYLFRCLITFFELIFYTSILVQALVVALRVSRAAIPTGYRILCGCVFVIAILTAVGLEAWVEAVRPPHNVCILGIYLNPFHWFILGFKLSVNGGTFTLCCVTLYGLAWLKFPPNASAQQTRIMTQNMVLFLVWVLYCFPCQLTPVFIDHMYAMGYSIDAVVYGTQVYVLMQASNGIVFAILTCFLDVEIFTPLTSGVRRYSGMGYQTPLLQVKVIKRSNRSRDGLNSFHNTKIVRWFD